MTKADPMVKLLRTARRVALHLPPDAPRKLFAVAVPGIKMWRLRRALEAAGVAVQDRKAPRQVTAIRSRRKR